jgi:hypothetical protein
MKSLYFAALASLSCGSGFSQEVISYLNYIRQFQTPSGVVFDASDFVANSGSMLSPLPIEKNGARFELWTMKSSAATIEELEASKIRLSSTYVASYIPTVNLTVYSDDATSIIPRTQVGRNFYVRLECGGLLKGATDPEASKRFNFKHHVQSYGAGGDGQNIDRDQATLFKEISITENGVQNLTFTFTSVPGADFANLSKIRGEERFSAWSLPDDRDGYHVDSLPLTTDVYIQIWPVSDGSISGLADNQVVRYSAPQVTLTMNGLYPSSTTYAQVYKGAPQLGVEGTILPGSSLIINDSVPNNRVLILKGYEEAFTEDGVWTMELLTKTPFGTDRLDYVSFTLDRTMKIKNTSINTIE